MIHRLDCSYRTKAKIDDVRKVFYTVDLSSHPTGRQ